MLEKRTFGDLMNDVSYNKDTQKSAKPVSFADFSRASSKGARVAAVDEEKYFQKHNKEKAEEASKVFKGENQKGPLDRLKEFFS